jgi:hypothetical protein
MKITRLLASVLALCGTIGAQAHPAGPDGRIVVSCSAQRAPRMADVARAIDASAYPATTPGARVEILRRAREACVSPETRAVAFVPPAAEDNGRATAE